MNARFAKTPVPPYYAVIFSAVLDEQDEGYAQMSEAVLALGLQQPGCLGVEFARDSERFGITVSYWESEAAIADWKANAKHLVAQNMGIERWYSHYTLRVAKIDREYSGPDGRSVG